MDVPHLNHGVPGAMARRRQLKQSLWPVYRAHSYVSPPHSSGSRRSRWKEPRTWWGSPWAARGIAGPAHASAGHLAEQRRLFYVVIVEEKMWGFFTLRNSYTVVSTRHQWISLLEYLWTRVCYRDTRLKKIGKIFKKLYCFFNTWTARQTYSTWLFVCIRTLAGQTDVFCTNKGLVAVPQSKAIRL